MQSQQQATTPRQDDASGVITGSTFGTRPSTPLLSDGVPEIDADPVSLFFWVGG